MYAIDGAHWSTEVDGTDSILLWPVLVRQVRSLPANVGRAAPRLGDDLGPLPVLALTPTLGTPTPRFFSLSPWALSSPLVATPLIGSLESW